MKTLTLKMPPQSILFAPCHSATTDPGTFALWLDRQRQRHHISRLDKHLLDDIGVGRIEADIEAQRWD